MQCENAIIFCWALALLSLSGEDEPPLLGSAPLEVLEPRCATPELEESPQPATATAVASTATVRIVLVISRSLSPSGVGSPFGERQFCAVLPRRRRDATTSCGTRPENRLRRGEELGKWAHQWLCNGNAHAAAARVNAGDC